MYILGGDGRDQAEHGVARIRLSDAIPFQGLSEVVLDV